MIQRRQTLYLIVAVVLIMSTLFGNIVFMSGKIMDMNAMSEFQFMLFLGSTEIVSVPVLTLQHSSPVIILVISGLISLGTIFLYQNLSLQKRLTEINFVLILLAFAGVFYSYYTLSIRSGSEILNSNFKLSALIPFFLIFFNFMAWRGIKKDIELLASADRLR